MIVTITIGSETKELSIPDDLSGLDKRHFKRLIEIKYTKTSVEDIREFLSEAMKFERRTLDLLTESAIIDLAKAIPLISEEQSSAASMFPRIFIWKGPKAGLANVTFKQFGLMEEAMGKLSSDLPEEETKRLLRRFMSASYTPFGIPWTNTIGNINSIAFRIFGRRKQSIAVAAYTSIRKWFGEIYELSFSSGGDGGRNFGFPGLIVDLAGPKFGDVKTAENQNVHSAFIHIEKQIQFALDHEK